MITKEYTAFIATNVTETAGKQTLSETAVAIVINLSLG
jgi:hypothetical protein